MMTIWQAFFIWSGIYWAAVSANKKEPASYIASGIGAICFIIGACCIK